MPNTKRERKKQARVARQQELLAQQARARRRKRIALAVAAVGAVVVLAAVFAGGGDDDERVTAGSDRSPRSRTTEPAAPATEGCPPAEGAPARTTKFEKAPPMCIDTSRNYTAQVETDVGAFTVGLDAKKAPRTVNNFVFLARHRFYDDVPFHRVIPGFVVQGGDAEKGDGTGGPGYTFDDELPKAGEYEIGSLAMANSGPDTNGSQFFVVTGEQGVALQPKYSLFGKVTAGMDVVKRIEADGSESGDPKVVHRITKVTIAEG